MFWEVLAEGNPRTCRSVAQCSRSIALKREFGQRQRRSFATLGRTIARGRAKLGESVPIDRTLRADRSRARRTSQSSGCRAIAASHTIDRAHSRPIAILGRTIARTRGNCPDFILRVFFNYFWYFSNCFGIFPNFN